MKPLILAAGTARATLFPDMGGRIAQCTLAGRDGEPRDIFFPFEPAAHTPDAWAKGGLYPLVPFSGRISHARLLTGQQAVALVPHSASDPHALHGIAQRRAWRVDDARPDAAQLSYEHQPDAHWPWRFHAQLEISLAPAALTVSVSCRNTDHCPWPAGVGLHPYLRCDSGDRLSFLAEACWPADSDALPLAAAPLAGSFRVNKEDWADEDLTRFHQHWQGRAGLESADGRSLLLEASPSFDHVVLHKPRDMPYLCIEPATHVPDAFNLAAQGVMDTGHHRLLPGETLTGWMRLSLP